MFSNRSYLISNVAALSAKVFRKSTVVIMTTMGYKMATWIGTSLAIVVILITVAHRSQKMDGEKRVWMSMRLERER